MELSQGSGEFIAKVKTLTEKDGALNFRPPPGKLSKCTASIDIYSGHNLMANGSGKSYSNWIVHCKIWEYTGDIGVTLTRVYAPRLASIYYLVIGSEGSNYVDKSHNVTLLRV